MTLSFGRLTPILLHLLGSFAGRGQLSRLDIKAMTDRDLADLNLPPEMKGRLTLARDIDRMRRGI